MGLVNNMNPGPLLINLLRVYFKGPLLFGRILSEATLSSVE